MHRRQPGPHGSSVAAVSSHQGIADVARLAEDGRIAQRIQVIWALLFFNTLAPIGGPTIVPIPQRIAQLLTMGALAAALVLAITLNPRALVRPNLVLGLLTLVAILSLMSSARGNAGFGALLRCVRLLTFVGVLWLLTPWWGRRDLLLARCHLRVVSFISMLVVIGLVIQPSMARSVDGRLGCIFWPIWPTAVAHFAAMMAGLSVLLWLAGATRGRNALGAAAFGLVIILLSQTRVAMVAVTLGLLFGGLTLVLQRQRARRVATAVLLVAPLVLVALAPLLLTWFKRGQSAQDLSNLTGRRNVWTLVLSAPRSTFTQWFGNGLSDKSFKGLSIDNSWLAIYHDQGRAVIILIAVVIFCLLLAAGLHAAGPGRAVAVFVLLYCAIDSYTEVGLGDASPYLLDLVVAASLLFPLALTRESEPL